MDLTSLYTVVAALFILIICGFIMRKKGIINDPSSKGFSRLVLELAQPALIISSLISMDIEKDRMQEILQKAGIVFVCGIAFHFLLALPAYFLVKPIKDGEERKISEFSLLFSNCGFMGLPVLNALFGPEGAFYGAFFIITFHLVLWTWGIAVFARGRSDIKLTPKKIFFNYGSVPAAIGIVLLVIKLFLPLPEFITLSLTYLSNICTPVSLLITGALIAKMSLKKVFCVPRIYYVSAIKLVLFPILICVITKLLGFDTFYVMFFTTMAALPSASTVTMLSETFDSNSTYASLTVGVSTLLSVLTIPLILSLAQWITSI